MKKIFKALAVAAASTALCAGVAMTTTGCSAGTNGTYVGAYHYIGAHSPAPYGIVVEVTVENNIITNIKEITNTEAAKSYQTYKDVVDGKEAGEATYHTWTTVSPGWETYVGDNALSYTYWAYPDVDFSDMSNDEKIEYVKAHPLSWYGWTDAASSNWSNHESWLLQQYVGWSVADILDLKVYTDYGYTLVTGEDGKTTQVLDKDSKGEPYGKDFNADLNSSGLLISGATQGSGRLILAIQDALTK